MRTFKSGFNSALQNKVFSISLFFPIPFRLFLPGFIRFRNRMCRKRGGKIDEDDNQQSFHIHLHIVEIDACANKQEQNSEGSGFGGGMQTTVQIFETNHADGSYQYKKGAQQDEYGDDNFIHFFA